MKQLISIFIAVFLLTSSYSEAKRSLGRGSSSRTTSSGGSRRTSSHVTYRPATSGSGGSQANSNVAKLSYPSSNAQPNHAGSSNIGWNAPQNKPQGPPPAYSPQNTAGGAKTNYNERPPGYNAPPAYPGTGANAPIRPATVRPVQSSYPRQPLPANSYPHNSAAPAGAGPPKYYPVGSAPAAGYHPAGSLPSGGQYHPPGGASYYPVGSAPAAGYHPGGYGGGFQPHAPPVYAGAGVQPGYYPAGSFPQKSSGPGLGTGLVAGAIGGAILGHVLTPSGNHYGGGGGGYGGGVSGGGGTQDSDRIIIINNTPGQPATVTTANGNQPIIVNGQPAQAGAPEAPVPLAPFQPGSTQVVNQPTSQSAAPMSDQSAAAAVAPPLVHSPNAAAPGQTYPEGTVPLAPLADSTNNPTEAPKSGGVMCYPVQVNITSETDPTNITTVEQIACYEVPAGFDPNAPAQPPQDSTTGAAVTPQKPDLMHMPGDTSATQRTSTATLAESSQIKQSGANGQHSTFSTISSTIAALIVAYCLQ